MTLSHDDDLWDEPRPYCSHTLRTCSPECPEWGGRAGNAPISDLLREQDAIRAERWSARVEGENE